MTTKAYSSGYSTAATRWAGLGPYYAMFPVSFAFEVIEEYSKPGDFVLDPFAGRASSIYAAAVLDRFGLGVEINPVGWLYGRIKLRPAKEGRVLKRLEDIGRLADIVSIGDVTALPEFFHCCYCPHVIRFLIAARRTLRWQTNRIDGTLMAIILVYLHGKKGGALSNQTRQGKAMAPAYSVNWWRENGHQPPDLDPVEFLTKRIKWRYAKGALDYADTQITLGDSLTVIPRLAQRSSAPEQKRFKLLFTSPPYCNVTNYHYDQWLRLWMLGGPNSPTTAVGPHQGKFASQTGYSNLLNDVFKQCSRVMTEDSVVYVRTDARSFTLDATKSALTKAFPSKQIEIIERPIKRVTQTALFGDKTKKPGEVDLIVR